jgi:hypothetical protein
MPNGKPAGVRCAQLSDDNRCLLYGDPRRPQACVRFRPSPEVCGASRAKALRLLAEMELASAPQDRGVLWERAS